MKSFGNSATNGWKRNKNSRGGGGGHRDAKAIQKWLGIRKFGTPMKLEDFNLVAFKCPRDVGVSHYNPDQVLRPDELIEHYREQGYKLTYVIDLTNTDRYYNRGAFSAEFGVHHFKFSLPGQQTPTQDYLNRFVNLVNGVR